MLPMSDRQVRLFAERSGVDDPAALLSELDRQKAWTFARRPLDLAELIGIWGSESNLGTRARQHEVNVTAKLKDDPDRPDRDVLPDTRARCGAERSPPMPCPIGSRRPRLVDQLSAGLLNSPQSCRRCIGRRGAQIGCVDSLLIPGIHIGLRAD